jgi:hypothetical protein
MLLSNILETQAGLVPWGPPQCASGSSKKATQQPSPFQIETLAATLRSAVLPDFDAQEFLLAGPNKHARCLG